MEDPRIPRSGKLRAGEEAGRSSFYDRIVVVTAIHF